MQNGCDLSVKKQVIALLSILFVLSGLLAALLLLRAAPPGQEEGGRLSMLESIEVFSFASPVAEVAVSPSDGSAAYTLKRLPGAPADADTQADAAGGTPSAVLAGREMFPLDEAAVASLLNAARNLTATRLLDEAPADYAPFGLDAPAYTVKISDGGGASETLFIGNYAPDASNRYIRLESKPAVYLIPVYRLSVYTRPETSYIGKQITFGSPADFETARQFTLGGTLRGEYGDTVITPAAPGELGPMDLFTHFLRSPVQVPLHYHDGPLALSALYGLQASAVAAINPDAAQLAQYGLAQPYSAVTVSGAGDAGDTGAANGTAGDGGAGLAGAADSADSTDSTDSGGAGNAGGPDGIASADGGNFTLLAGKPDGAGMVYLMREGLPLVFQVEAAKLPWLEMQFFDLMERSVSGLYLDEVAEITVAAGQDVRRFILAHEEDGRLRILTGGREAHRGNFMTFCETLRGARYEEYTTDPLPAGAVPDVRVTYRYVSGAPDKVISFYAGPARKYFITGTGMDFRFYTSSLYVDRVLAEAAAAALPNQA